MLKEDSIRLGELPSIKQRADGLEAGQRSVSTGNAPQVP
jgi:hypothetical protein